MNAQQFVEEVMHSPFATENFQQQYADFQEYQQLAMQTLDAFCHVCEKHHIPYQLAWGSLLGAIRDGGQIPWDYDVDVFVPYKEKDRLLEALDRDLDENYYVYCPETAPRCRHCMMRLAPKGYHSDVLHVDVFYLIGAPEDPEERAVFAKRVAAVANQRYQKLVDPFRASMGRFKSFVKLCLMRLKMLPVSLEDIEKEYHSLCTKYDFDSAAYCISADVFAADASFPATAIKTTLQYATSQGSYAIPTGHDEILRLLYKNYMQAFPLENRIQEMTGHYQTLKRFAKK